MAFKIRLGGTSEFVSEIEPFCNCCAPQGHAEFVEGWDNPAAIIFPTSTAAFRAADKIWDIEGFHTTIEPHD